MLSKLTNKEVLELVITVLMAHHMREQDRLDAMISDYKHKNRWADHWPKFKEAVSNESDALICYTQYIQSQLDGGECSLPDSLSLL